MSAMTSASTSISQQNAQSAGSEDKAQLVYTDIDRDRGDVNNDQLQHLYQSAGSEDKAQSAYTDIDRD